MNIDIELGLYKSLTALLRNDGDTYSAVISRLLQEGGHREAPSDAVRPAASHWKREGVILPAGRRLRFQHKGTSHYAVIRDGRIELSNGQSFDAPSAAAGAITGNSVNGWILWEAEKLRGGTWLTLDQIRKIGRAMSTKSNAWSPWDGKQGNNSVSASPPSTGANRKLFSSD